MSYYNRYGDKIYTSGDDIPDLTQRYPEGFGGPYEPYEPSDAEILDSEIKSQIYNAKINILSGEPSDFVNNLCSEWSLKEPVESDYEDRNAYIYGGYSYSHDRTLDIVSKIAEHYGCDVESTIDNHRAFYDISNNSFAIAVEYHESTLNKGNVHNKVFSGLDYDTFKNIFRDLYVARLYPSINYCDERGRNNIRSNMSLGSLKYSDFKNWGIESDASIEAELKNAGFDENELRDSLYELIKENPDMSDAYILDDFVSTYVDNCLSKDDLAKNANDFCSKPNHDNDEKMCITEAQKLLYEDLRMEQQEQM